MRESRAQGQHNSGVMPMTETDWPGTEAPREGRERTVLWSGPQERGQQRAGGENLVATNDEA